jgi:hypothetical protein
VGSNIAPRWRCQKKRRTVLDANSSRSSSDLKSFTEGEEKLFEYSFDMVACTQSRVGQLAFMALRQHPNDNRTSRLWLCPPN